MASYQTLESIEFATSQARCYADYWESLPKIDLIPMRSSFDPVDVVPILPGFSVHEFQSSDMILVRLAGTAVVERFGYEPTGGNHLDSINPKRRQSAYHALSNIIRQPCGMVVHVRMFRKSGVWIDCEVLGLPFRSENGEANVAIYHSNNLSGPTPHSLSDTKIDSMPLWREYLDIGAGVPEWVDVTENPLDQPIPQSGSLRPDTQAREICDIPYRRFSGHRIAEHAV